MTPPVAALIFDVFGTVVDWRSGVAAAAAALLGPYLPALDAADFADGWRRRYAPAMQAVREGRRAYVKLDVLHRENLDAELRARGIEDGAVPAATLDELNQAWHRLDPWPDSVAGLTRLKTRFILAPHSNGHVRLMIDLARHGGLPWDAILGAELSRTYKPDLQTYRDACSFLDLPPERVCMVAAHNGDLAAAREAGLHTAFIPRPLEYGPGQSTDLAPTQNWDCVAADMGDLATQFGA